MDTPDPAPQSPTPPTLAPPLPDKPSTWPAALGAVAVAFGVLGALGALMGLLMVVFQDAYFGMFGSALPAETTAEIAAASPHPVLGALLQVFGLLWAILLLVAGARLMKRRRSGPKLLRIWAIVKILLVAIGALIGAQIAMAQTSPAAGMPAGFQTTIAVASLLVALLWGCALPVFSLIWLRRASIRAEVAGWAP